MNAQPQKSRIALATYLEPHPHESRDFLITLLVVLVIVGGAGYWNGWIDSIDVNPRISSAERPVYSIDETIYRWFLQRRHDAYSIEILRHETHAREVTVHFLQIGNDGRPSSRTIIFSFDRYGNFLSASSASYQPLPGPTIAHRAPTYYVPRPEFTRP